MHGSIERGVFLSLEARFLIGMLFLDKIELAMVST